MQKSGSHKFVEPKALAVSVETAETQKARLGEPTPSGASYDPRYSTWDVGSEPHVVGQVIAVVIGILVDHDVVAIPEPVVAEANINVDNAEVEAAKPEAIGAATAKMPDMAAAESAGEVSVFPSMIEVIAGIIAAGVVADPFAVGVNMRRIGMSRLVVEVSVFLSRMRLPNRSRTAGGYVSSTAATVVLRPHWE